MEQFYEISIRYRYQSALSMFDRLGSSGVCRYRLNAAQQVVEEMRLLTTELATLSEAAEREGGQQYSQHPECPPLLPRHDTEGGLQPYNEGNVVLLLVILLVLLSQHLFRLLRYVTGRARGHRLNGIIPLVRTPQPAAAGSTSASVSPRPRHPGAELQNY